MATIKTSELSGPTLDWAVAQCEGRIYGLIGTKYEFQPSTHWAHGGPIIERERISVDSTYTGQWSADGVDNKGFSVLRVGPTPLVAAMRCHVASKIGDKVEIPDSLIVKG